jgi:hypothetical protein
MDETLGPVAISLKRERVETDLTTNGCSLNPSVIFRYRIIIRTSEVNKLYLKIIKNHKLILIIFYL